MSLSLPTSSGQVSIEVGAHALPEWAAPLANGTCGPNLEYDAEFLALQHLALGRPETQFEPVVPPDWHAVEKSALHLLTRTRDLRIVALWLEARLNLAGLACLPEGLDSMASLLEQAWPLLNPPLDEGDPYARLNVLESLGPGGSFFLSLRNCRVLRNSRIGDLRLKDFEALAGLSDASRLPIQREQVEQFLRSPEGRALQLSSLAMATLAALHRLQHALSAHVEAPMLPRFKEVKALLACLKSCLPINAESQHEHSATGSGVTTSIGSWAGLAQGTAPCGSPLDTAQSSVALFPAVTSREHALQAIRQVCIYLEQAEPTNPAPLLLNRASQLMDKPFLQLVRQLAPDALSEVARIMGIHPDSLEQHDQ